MLRRMIPRVMHERQKFEGTNGGPTEIFLGKCSSRQGRLTEKILLVKIEAMLLCLPT